MDPLASKASLVYWERRWLAVEELAPTTLASYSLTRVTLACTAIIGSLLVWMAPPLLWLLAPLLGRLAALDLCYRVIPNIYSAALAIIGILYQLHTDNFPYFLWGFLTAAAVLALIIGLNFLITRKPPTMGGGDIKFILAMSIYLAPSELIWALFVASLLAFPFTFKKDFTNGIPFGPALALSFSLFL